MKNLKKQNKEDSFGIRYDDNEDILDSSKNVFAKTEDFSKKNFHNFFDLHFKTK